MNYKTFYQKETKLFGIIEFTSEDSRDLIVYVSTMPRLFSPSATMELLVKYYNSLDPNSKFEDLVKEHNLDLVEIELKILE